MTFTRRTRAVGPYVIAVTAADRPRMAWFLRAIEQTDGSWACKHGRTVFDRHDGLPEALEHLHGIAETIRPAELYVHWLDGTVQNVGPLESRRRPGRR